MKARCHKTTRVGENVIERATARIRHAFDVTDRPVVLFSGGKDSTVLLNLAIQVAGERGRLPLDVLFFDEEAIAPETEEYVLRVGARPEVRLLWSCVPIKHRNACSRHEPWWETWEPGKEALWCRPRPTWAITKEMRPDIPLGQCDDQVPYFFGPEKGTVAKLMGRRADESMIRRRMILLRDTGFEAFMSAKGDEAAPWIRTCDPVYDFAVEDVWLAIHSRGWDYNRAYDKFAMLGMNPNKMRVAPPYGEEPSQNLWMWSRAWPELWDRMQLRVEGADAGARYANTSLYFNGGKQDSFGPGEGETWRDYVSRLILRHPANVRGVVAANVAEAIRAHQVRCKKATGRIDPIPEIAKHPITGICWRSIARMVGRGGLKHRTVAGATMLSSGAVAKARAARQARNAKKDQ